MKKYLFPLLAIFLLTCYETDHRGVLPSEIYRRFGWLINDEDPSNIPNDVAPHDSVIANLPSSVSLENKFPPIGDQGDYGTCIAWSVGYNLKTALNAIDREWSSSDAARASNQTSPADLWKLIPSSQKNRNCDGTNFEPAFNALIDKGAKSLSEAPYTSGFCSATSNGDANNKIALFRTIAYNGQLGGGGASASRGMNVANFKAYLADGRPIAFGAKLGDRFINWKGSAVLSSDTYNGRETRNGAYHAIVLSGYDDSKRAFRVRNSWTSEWGDAGSIWISYDFFINSFCFVAYVAQNPEAQSNYLQKPSQSSGYDLIASRAADIADPDSADARSRRLSYDIYNGGSLPVTASQRWSALYLYYNAYDANDMGVIFEDYYTDEFGGKRGGVYNSSLAIAGSCFNPVDVLPDKKAGEAEFGERGFYVSYKMPAITGRYYLVLIADANDNIAEADEGNNFYFITAENGKPLEFSGGVLQSTIAAPERVPGASVAQLGEANAYTPSEVKAVFERSKLTGALARKRAEFRQSGAVAVKRLNGR